MALTKITSRILDSSGVTILGTIATGVWQGTDIAVLHGGTGASTAGAARTNLGLVIGTHVLAQRTFNDTNWDNAYTDRLKWDGGATGLTASTGRTSLGLGTVATTAASDYATAAQGTKADTAHGWGDHTGGGYVKTTTDQTIAGVKTFSGGGIFSSSSQGKLKLVAGSNEYLSLEFANASGATQWEISKNNTHDLYFYKGGYKMMLKADGKVGIGTTTFESSWTGYTVLKIGADNSIYGNTATNAGSAFFISQNLYQDASNHKYVGATSNSAGVIDLRDGTFTYSTAPAGTAGNNATITPRLSISNAGVATFSGDLVLSSTSTGPNIDITGHAGASNYNYFLRAYNDGGAKAAHFVNGSSRTADGGTDTYTIRNDGGRLNLGKSSYLTTIIGSSILAECPVEFNKVWGSSAPVFKAGNTNNSIASTTYDTAIIQADDVTSIRIREFNGGGNQEMGLSVGDNNASITSTENIRFYTGATAGNMIYNGQGGVNAMTLAADGKVTIQQGLIVGTDNTLLGSNYIKGDVYRPGAGNYVERIFDVAASSSGSSWIIARQFHDHVNWGNGNINVIIQGTYYSHDKFFKGDFSCRYGYGGGSATITTNFNGGVPAPTWQSAVNVSGNIYYRNLVFAGPAYTKFTVRIILTGGLILTSSSNASTGNLVWIPNF